MKANWEKVIDVIDSLRLFDRFFLGAWSAFTMWIGWYLVHWYTVQPANERGYEESVALIGVFTGCLGIVKTTWDTFSRWDANPAKFADAKDDPPAQ